MRYILPRTINDLDSVINLFSTKKTKYYDIAIRNAEWVYIRSRLSEAQNHRCCWCGCMTVEDRGKKNSSTVEHYVPRSLGGTDDMNNLVMACHDCNNKRGTLEVEEFMSYKECKVVRGKMSKREKIQRKVYWIELTFPYVDLGSIYKRFYDNLGFKLMTLMA